jgi:HEAT repeat protein
MKTTMELSQIKAYLDSPNPQARLKAIVELRNYNPSVVVPLLKQRMYDKEFVIRSFVAMGLGYKRTDEGFQSLLDLIENDGDPNVKAEAANSLANYGEKAIPHLVELFRREPHWLVRQSIFAVMDEIDSPDVFLKLSNWGLEGDDLVVKLAAIANLGRLKGTPYEQEAVDLLFELSTAETAEIRVQVARVLGSFDDPKAKAALAELRHDSDYRVIGATLEGMIR